MPMDSDDIKVRLLESDEQYRQLAAQHQELERRLNSLIGQVYLTDLEQAEEKTLKKQKLQLKDQMESILRHHRGMLGAPATAPTAAGSPARG
jgi:uncharacterized protein YdcH (DUF465 family)